MFTRIVSSSSTRYHVATDIGWPLGITIAITAGLGSRSRAAAPSGSGAFGIGRSFRTGQASVDESAATRASEVRSTIVSTSRKPSAPP